MVFYVVGCLIVMMSFHCSAVLEVIPPLLIYNNSTIFTAFFCTNNVDYSLSDEEIEWLYANFTSVTSTSRIESKTFLDTVKLVQIGHNNYKYILIPSLISKV